jgi:hypothetical protein
MRGRDQAIHDSAQQIAFYQYKNDMGRELTPEQKSFLRSIGLKDD